ncbi:Protein LURP-one-related 15 [Melia azedarach]|uniref:Protein LURP-one-related 15 n=1 Tax=Melia azedarach TaxID=155640 RepID=A0ACC1X0T3_MELAZ|nr:Protein LURP-one-related 15 [Melia azedarach]
MEEASTIEEVAFNVPRLSIGCSIPHANLRLRSCIVYAGETNAILAQMHKKTTIGSVLLDKDQFMVTVYPNIDYAFIVALIVILDDINRNTSGN